MHSERRLTGRIVDPSGEPIPGATIFTTRRHGARFVWEQMKSGRDGRFESLSNEERDISVGAEAPGFARGHWLLRTRRRGHAGDFGDLRLVPGITVRGRVLDGNGAPIRDAEVGVRTSGLSTTGRGPEGTRPRFGVDDEGRFGVGPLGPGSHKLKVRAAGFADGRVVVHVGAVDRDRDVGSITLVPEVRIAGCVVDASDRPVPGFHVRVDHSDGAATADEGGRFEIGGQSAAARSIHVRARGFRSVRHHLGDARDEVRIVMRPKDELRGSVVDATTGEPVEIVSLRLHEVHRRSDGTPEFHDMTQGWEQPETGRFRVQYQAPCEYQIVVEAAGYQPGELLLEPIERPTVVTGLRIALVERQGCHPMEEMCVRGVVPEADRLPETRISAWYPIPEPNVPNQEIHRGCPVSAGAHCYTRIGIESDGRFEVRLPRTDWFIVLESPRRDVEMRTVSSAEGEGEAVLDFSEVRAGSLEGVVVGLEGSEWRNVFVVVFGRNPIRRECATGPDGSFRFDGLPEGRYAVRAGHDGVLLVDGRRPRDYDVEDFEHDAEPWKGAVVVDVVRGRTRTGLEVRLGGQPRGRSKSR